MLWIVVNEYLRTDKFKELENRLINACLKTGIDYNVVTNSECIISCEEDVLHTGIIPNNCDPVLFFDKDILLARALENNGHRVFNSAKAIEICDDKAYTSLELAACGISIPKTIIAPMTYSNIGYSNTNYINEVIESIGFPMIVKESFGSFGMGVYLAYDKESLYRIVDSTKDKKLIFQSYIESSSGKDIRIQVVGGKVISAMYRYSVNGDFRANITNGGHMKAYKPTDEECLLAITVADRLGLDFAGIDILFGDAGPVLCEINSNAHFVNLDNCTGSDIAYDIIRYIISTGVFL